MSQISEAAGLLQNGAIYPQRIGLRPTSGAGEMALFGFKHGAASLYFGDEPIYHFDLEGRWQRAYREGVHYLKGLDNAVVAIERVREGENLVLRRRPLPFAESSDLDASIREAALALIGALNSGRLQPVAPPAPASPIAMDRLVSFLERVASWDAAAWFSHRERYLGTYGLLPFLPPGSQPAVVLQATLGHAGGLTFGAAPASEHYVRSTSEFAEHAETVATLLGKRVVPCRCVFLAGSDLLHRPPEAIVSYLEATARAFPIVGEARSRRLSDRPLEEARLDGIHAFLDRFEGPRPDRDTWRRFRSLQLRRVDLGVESGSLEVRDLYGKTWADDDLLAVVADLKAAEIEVGLMVLVGAGGTENADRHERATVDLLERLDLGPGDLISLLDAEEVGGVSAQGRLRDQGLTLLDGASRRDQQGRLKALLAPLRSRLGVKVAPYSLEKQWA